MFFRYNSIFFLVFLFLLRFEGSFTASDESPSSSEDELKQKRIILESFKFKQWLTWCVDFKTYLKLVKNLWYSQSSHFLAPISVHKFSALQLCTTISKHQSWIDEHKRHNLKTFICFFLQQYFTFFGHAKILIFDSQEQENTYPKLVLKRTLYNSHSTYSKNLQSNRIKAYINSKFVTTKTWTSFQTCKSFKSMAASATNTIFPPLHFCAPMNMMSN